MTQSDWERRLPDGVRLESRGGSGFRLGVSLPVGKDGLWPMRCPQHPLEHIFKIAISQNDGAKSTALYCPYCGHREDDLWAFAPEQHAVMMAAARAAAEQYVVAALNDMLGNAFGGRAASSSHRSGVSYTSGRSPSRRTLPTIEIDETRRTMQCGMCQEQFAVYGLAIYCPNCGRMAPAQQFSELLRVQVDRLAALNALADDQRRSLAEGGVLTANYESTIKDGFTALETYLNARFASEAPTVSLYGRGAIFQRLDDAADLFADHLNVDLRALTGNRWQQLLRIAAIRHVLVHNAGVVDAKFLDRAPDWPQHIGQRLHVTQSDARGFLFILVDLAAAISTGTDRAAPPA